MFQRVLKGYEEALGPDHTSTLNSVNNLGNLFADQGKLKEAESMFQRALKGYEEALGSELVKTYVPALNTVENLARLYQVMGKATQAEHMYKQAIIGLEAVFGCSSQRYKNFRSAFTASQNSK